MEQQVIPSDYTQYAEAVEIIKHAIERCRYRSAAAVNKETLSLYFGVGKFVSENSRIGCWGTKALPTISKLLQRELPGLHGFSESGLKRMRSFYEEWRTFLIRPTVLGELENHSSEKGTALIHPTALGELDIDEHLLLQLIGQPVNTEFTWDDFVKISFSHHIEILTRSKDIAERLFYIHCAAQNAWSLSSLKNYLKEDIYSNRGSLPSNFLQVLPEAIYAVKAILAFKDEYMLEMVNLENVGEREQDWNEKVIENLNVLDYDYYFRLTDLFNAGKVGEAFLLFNEIIGKGFDGGNLIAGLGKHFRDVLVSKDPATVQLLEVSAGIKARYAKQAADCQVDFLYEALKIVEQCEMQYKVRMEKRLCIELALIKLCQINELKKKI